MSKSPKFDIAIFDEAHKTAERTMTRFSFALRNDNLKVRKRLFMTATIRRYNPMKKDKEGDLKMVFSMDVPETYRSVTYRLTFAEAAKRKIICDYLTPYARADGDGWVLFQRNRRLSKRKNAG